MSFCGRGRAQKLTVVEGGRGKRAPVHRIKEQCGRALLKVCAATAADEQRIASEHHAPPPSAVLVAHATIGVACSCESVILIVSFFSHMGLSSTRRGHDAEFDAADSDLIAFLKQ